MKILEVAFTGYPVTDIQRARAFYEGVLGLKPDHFVELPSGVWIEYFLGSHTLAISNMAANWRPSQDGPCAALEVEDFDEAIRELRSRGVPFVTEVMDTPVCHMCVVRDPDDNLITIHKCKPGHL